jgi:crotonobetaine/carnitine-CoA ligase
MTAYYEDLQPRVADRAAWTLAATLQAQAATRPDATFLITPEESRSWTYGEIFAEAQSVAGALLGAGAVSGDRVLIMALNSSALMRTWFGCALGNLVEVPINTAYEGEFLRHQIVTVTPRWAVVDDAFAERFVALGTQAASVERFWVVDKGNQRAAIDLLRAQGWQADAWEDLAAGEQRQLPDPAPQDLASILFTSGTTGPSKGVAMPHAQMHFFAEEVVAMTRLTESDTYLTMTPLFHGNAQFMAAYPALIAGARLVVRSKFSASRWVDFVREHGITVTNFLGVMMDFAWGQPPRENDADNTLRCIFAAPTASTYADEFRKRYDIEAFVEAFGLTETSAPFISPYGQPRPPGAVGLLAHDYFDVRLADPETDEEVDVGQVGELLVRHRHPWTGSLGYYNMPDKTTDAWRNLWFHTGDALRRDDYGWYYFVDRYKDALRRRGENISSYEVEQAILGLDGVVECAVIGVAADVEAGEDEVMAIVVTSEPATAADVWAWCEGRIPAFAIPRFVRFVDALPKTPSEKVRKAALRDDGITADTADRTQPA